MKSIERRFIKSKESIPLASDYINFAIAVTGGGFSESVIRRWFYKLVPKADYERKDKKKLFLQLVALSNPLRTTKIDTKTTPEAE